MATEEKYNGYANYETWAVCLWLDNDEGIQREAYSLANGPTAKDNLEDGTTAQAFKEWVNEMAPDLGATLWADLFNAALSEVHWQEVAQNFYDADAGGE